MKKMFAAAALIAVTTVHAEEISFGDINFFVPQGKFILSAEADQTTKKTKVANNDTTLHQYDLSSRLNYGVSDRFNLFVDIKYDYLTDTSPGGNQNNDGFQNPGLGTNYRLLRQNDSGVNFDLGAFYHHGIEKAKRADFSKKGNAANGRDSLEINASLGKKWNEANEWRLTAGAVQNMDGDYKQVGASKVTQDSSTDAYVRASYQYRPVREFMMNFSAVATRIAELKQKTVGVTSKDTNHVDYDFIYNARYLITDNFIARFNLGISRNADFKTKSQGTSFDTEKRRERFLGLGVDWLF